MNREQQQDLFVAPSEQDTPVDPRDISGHDVDESLRLLVRRLVREALVSRGHRTDK